jgi:hypothetical protein
MSDENTIIINLDNIEPVQFEWNESDMNIGVIAQQLNTMYSPVTTSGVSITSGSTIGAVGAAGTYTISTPYEDMEQRLAKLEKIIADEELVRRTHPAIQTAYDHYKLLLVLAGKLSPEELT